MSSSTRNADPHNPEVSPAPIIETRSLVAAMRVLLRAALPGHATKGVSGSDPFLEQELGEKIRFSLAQHVNSGTSGLIQPWSVLVSGRG